MNSTEYWEKRGVDPNALRRQLHRINDDAIYVCSKCGDRMFWISPIGSEPGLPFKHRECPHFFKGKYVCIEANGQKIERTAP